MNTLGGGTTHAAMGMRVWSNHVRPVAAIGRDFPPGLVETLGGYFDLQGLVRRDLPNPRAWQLFEENGRRSEVFRTAYTDFLAINPLPHELPLERLRGEGVHLQSHSPEPSLQWIDRLRDAGSPYILFEPWDNFCVRQNFELFCQVARRCDAVSPNLDEARALTGLWQPWEAAACLLQNGAALVVLRMGAQGSLVASRAGDLLQVAAAPVEQIVDVTGAGNAFCGGWITGMVESGDLAVAARRAAISASLAIEQYGALYPLQGLPERVAARLKHAAAQA
ncbi:MAG TPA: PfkB family carbohydrate kinase [Levilinea sp.]|nr:PfkB family carbohydrate kinase [Levilinea sp.]